MTRTESVSQTPTQPPIRSYDQYKPIDISNEQFVAEMYAGLQGNVLLLSIEGPPGEAPPEAWGRTQHNADQLNPSNNNYASLATFRGTRRRKGEIVECGLIMIDDIILFPGGIGGKIDPARVRLPPSSLIETSPGNAQAVYKITPAIRDHRIADRLLDSLVDTFGGTDPGMAGANRLYKLPVGRNGKPAALGWRNRLIEYHPSLTYSIEALCAAYEIDVSEIVQERRQENVDLSHYPNGGPVVAALEWASDRGMVFSEKNGICSIECPWIEEHTNVDPTGTAVGRPGTSSAVPGYWFKCHHGHCEDRTLNDFMRWCRNQGFHEADALQQITRVPFDTSAAFAPYKPKGPCRKKWPSHLLDAPGLVGELANYALETSPRPQPILAIAAGLAAVAAATSNRYVVEPWGTRLNLYIVTVAPTGSGKDRPARLVNSIACLAPDVRAIGGAASGQALIKALAETPNASLWIDEVWQLIEGVNSLRGSPHQKDLGAMLMQLYSSSGDHFHGKVYADPRSNIPALKYPYLVFTGSTTPQRFIEALTNKQVADGLLNRLIVFRSDYIPPNTPTTKRALPDSIKDAIEGPLFQQEDSPSNPRSISIQDNAFLALNAWGQECDQEGNRGLDLSPLWSRGLENAVKVAGVVAVGVNSKSPVIDQSIAQWAVDLIRHCLVSLSQDLASEMVESEFDKNVKRALDAIRDPQRYKGDRQFGAICSQGIMPRGKISKILKLKARDVDDVLLHLVETKSISRVEAPGSGLRNVVCYVALEN